MSRPHSSQIVVGYTSQAMEGSAYSARETAIHLLFHSIQVCRLCHTLLPHIIVNRLVFSWYSIIWLSK